jgi:uncharacterized membrane protein YkgB
VATPESAAKGKRRGLPAWLMPIGVVVGIYLIFVLSGLINGLIGGLIGGLISAAVAVTLVVWLQRRADAYVRSKASFEDEQPTL